MSTNKTKNKELQQGIRDFILGKDGIGWTSCLSVTLTMKQFAEGESLDQINASRNMRHFLNRLNKSVYGNAWQRFDCRVNVLPVQECTDRIHYHLLIEPPKTRNTRYLSREEFKSRLEECWKKTKFGHQEICIKELEDGDSMGKWCSYITKFKNGDSDQLDWENYHWN